VVVDDVSAAADLLRAGADVVLILPPEAPPVDLWRGGRGRFAVYVGDPSSPETRAGAREMERELFARPRAAGPTIPQ